MMSIDRAVGRVFEVGPNGANLKLIFFFFFFFFFFSFPPFLFKIGKALAGML
jgi:hypothetical protein